MIVAPITNDNLTMRLAQTKDDIAKAQKLRYEHLLLEYNKEHAKNLTTDSSEQDCVCDHILVIDNNTDEVVGTYRLLTSAQVKTHNVPFCADCEFDISKLREKDDILEIGRAVVHKDYRDGSVFKLLWKGILEYCKAAGIRYIFGTASYHGLNPEKYKNSFSDLVYNYKVDDEFDCPAKQPMMPLNMLPKEDIDQKLARYETPSLIRAYLAIGAKVGSTCYIDHWFNCVDIFIIFDFKNINRPMLKRMFGVDF